MKRFAGRKILTFVVIVAFLASSPSAPRMPYHQIN